MELRGFSGLNGNYIVFWVTIHDKYELLLTGACIGANVSTLSNTSTLHALIRIRNFCFSCRESGVVSCIINFPTDSPPEIS